MKNLLHISALASLMIIFAACAGPGSDAVNDFTWTSTSESAIADFETGLQHQEAGNNTASRMALDNAISKDPNFASAFVFRSYTSGSAKEFADDNAMALSLIDNVSEPEKLMIQINQTYLNGESSKRVALYEQLTTLLPESARAWTYRAGDLSGRDETNQARDMYEQAIALDPDFTGAYVAAGGNYLFAKPKDFDKAKSMFEKAGELSPDMAFIQINLGDAYRALDDLEASAGAYNRALEMDNTLFTAYMKRGHVNSFLGNYEEARADYVAARNNNNNTGNQGYNFEAFINLYASDDAQATLEELEGAMSKIENTDDISDSRKQSGKTGAAYAGSWIAFHKRMPTEFDKWNDIRAELDMKNAMDIATEDAEQNSKADALIWKGMGSLIKGEFEAATKAAEQYKLLKTDDDNPNAMNQYYLLTGIIQYEQGDYDAAIGSFKSGTGDNLYRNYYLAKSYMAAGNEEEAMPVMKNVAMNNFNGVFYALVRNEARGVIKADASM